MTQAELQAHQSPGHVKLSAAAAGTKAEDHQQHPIKVYFVVWGWLFVLSAASYMVDYAGLEGYLRWGLILLFMMLKAALPVCAPEVIGIFGEKAHVSAEFKVRKPEPLVYRLICEKYGHGPAQSAFIDDKAENVTGAEEAGLQGHVYTSPEGLRSFLQSHGLI